MEAVTTPGRELPSSLAGDESCLEDSVNEGEALTAGQQLCYDTDTDNELFASFSSCSSKFQMLSSNANSPVITNEAGSTRQMFFPGGAVKPVILVEERSSVAEDEAAAVR